jgi:hypothetical protein
MSPSGRWFLSFDRQVVAIMHGGMSWATLLCGRRMRCPGEKRHRTKDFRSGSGLVTAASPVGACLEVSSQVGIPNDFILVVGYDKFKQTCHVVWRSDTRLGVEFRRAA